MYLKEQDFSNHQIIKIVMKLYSFLERLASKNVSSAFNLFVSEKKNELYTHFGAEVDLDDRATQMLSSRPSKVTKPLTEDLLFFMFILKISRQIEITVQLPNMKEPINKLVYFRRIPETFFLESKVKKAFLDRVQLNGKRYDFIKHFNLFFTEMTNNYNLYVWTSLIFYLTKNDTFELIKRLLWLTGFGINILCLVTYELNDFDSKT